MSPRTCALALALVALAPRPASACSKRHQTPFELFDLAARVAEVRVVQTPPPREAGFATLGVLRTLKGGMRGRLRGSETNTSCHVGYRAGRRALVFLGPRGETLGHFEGYLELREDDPLLLAIRAYAAARSDGARTHALVDAIATGPARVRDEAATHLASRPELLAWIGLPERERLLAAHESDPRDAPLLVALARLGLDATAPPHARTPWFAALAALLRPRDELDDLNVEALAGRIEHGAGERDPQRIRALDRCERLTGRSLYPLFSYGGGVAEFFWKTLAQACRSGKPVDG